MHVYWNADKDLAGLESKLPMLGGLFRHELSQLHCGCVPHVNLVFGRSIISSDNLNVNNHLSSFSLILFFRPHSHEGP